MGKKHFRSDFSEEESHFFTDGRPLIGESNLITSLFRLAGKYYVLSKRGLGNQIREYNPDTDFIFRYENAGYTIINENLKNKGISISRKYLKNISRKWSPSQIVLSFKTDAIITELISFFQTDPALHDTYINYLNGRDTNWHDIMPIQYSFLGVRLQRHGPKFTEAQRIINALPDIEV